MTPKLTRLWHNEMSFACGMHIELRADFDNDRHHAVLVKPPHGPGDLATALDRLAMQIRTDPDLQPEQAPNALANEGIGVRNGDID